MNTAPITLTDDASWRDLGNFFGRAHRAETDGDGRLQGHGDTLVATVCPISGDGLPVVIGMRVFALAKPWHGDVLSPLAEWMGRLAHADNSPNVPIPPVQSIGAPWVGRSVPRSGWERSGGIATDVLRDTAASGVEHIAHGTPAGSGAHIVTSLRAQVWSAPLASHDVPALAAFTGDVLGFWGGTEPATVHHAPGWIRLSTTSGHVLVRAGVDGALG